MLSGGPIAAAAISQSYTATEPVTAGEVLSLNAKDPHKVSVATAETIDSLLGVAVDPINSSISLNQGTSTTAVITSGQAAVLVSDINGEVKAGDYVTASPLKGVAMKTTTGTVLGIAQTTLATAIHSDKILTDKTGKKHTVKLGRINVSVDVRQLPEAKSSAITNTIQRFANNTAHHNVSTWRIYVSGGVLLIIMVVVLTLTYGGISRSIIAVGRNPLASQKIYKALGQILMVVFTVLAAGLAIIYFLLIL